MHQNYKFFILFFITFSNYFFAAHQDPEKNIFINTPLATILRNETSFENKMQLFRNFLTEHCAYISTEQKKALPYCNNQTIAHLLVNENEFDLLHLMVFHYSENLATSVAKQEYCKRFEGSTALLVLCCKLHSYRDNVPTYNLMMKIVNFIKEKYPSSLFIARADGITPQQILDKHRISQVADTTKTVTDLHTDTLYHHFCVANTHCPYCGRSALS